MIVAMIQARFRFRAHGGLEVEDRHADVIGSLRTIAWLWDRPPAPAPADVPLSSNGESASCSLNPYLKSDIKGAISYAARYSGGMPDKAMFDDVLTLQLEEDANHYSQFSGLIFGEVVKAFSAYRAAVLLDLDLDMEDFEKIVELAQSTGKDVDGRDSIYRFNPVSYFDDQLCRRAFGFGAEEVVARLSGQVERASIQDGGALVVTTTDLLDQENLRSLHDYIVDLLGVDCVLNGD